MTMLKCRRNKYITFLEPHNLVNWHKFILDENVFATFLSLHPKMGFFCVGRLELAFTHHKKKGRNKSQYIIVAKKKGPPTTLLQLAVI